MNEKQTHTPASSFSVKLGNTTYTVGIHFGKIINSTLENKVK